MNLKKKKKKYDTVLNAFKLFGLRSSKFEAEFC